MTDITRLLASLKRRSAHAKEFGDSITFVKLEDLDALVEALEKAQTERDELQQGFIANQEEANEAIKYATELKEQLARACAGREETVREVEEIQKTLDHIHRRRVIWRGKAVTAEDEVATLRQRISELEESNAQVIHSRDHYKRMSEEGLKQLAESRTVTVKLSKDHVDDADLFGWGVVVPLEALKEACADAGVTVEIADAVIKWEAE